MASFEHCGQHHHQYPIGTEYRFCVAEREVEQDDAATENTGDESTEKEES